MNLNKVFIIGRVTSDIVLKATASNQPVTNFSMATNRTWTDKSGARQESSEFHNIVVWGRQAEIASQFLSKGSLALVEGRLQTRTWKDANGQNHRTTEIVCEHMQLGPRSAGSAGGGGTRPQANAGSGINQSAGASDGFDDTLEEGVPEISLDDEIKPEDLPF